MPQMSPINWIFMYILFLATLMVLMVKLYFNKNYSFSSVDPNKPLLSTLIFNKWMW